MKNGCCEILGIFLEAHDVHCHHVKPRNLGGTDKYDNLRIIHEDMHRLVHATEKETIDKYLVKWKLNQNSKLIEKINALRKKCKNEPIVI